MKMLLFALALVLAPAPGALAGEKVVATNYYVTESKAWPTGEKTGYWMVRFTGVSEMLEGPIDTLAVECNGAGFWDASGATGNGICVHGTGDDTFILRFDARAGGVPNSWKILSGKGKYKGLTGAGTASTKRLPGNRRISNLEGEVEFTK